jgi:plastocyanin
MKKTISIFLASAIVLVMASMATARVKRPGAAARSAAAATVKISNFQFTPKTLAVPVGGTVEWNNEAGRHMVEADDGSFKSEVLKAGDKFSFTFAKAGKYPYHCTFHGDKGGKDMAGTIVVK